MNIYVNENLRELSIKYNTLYYTFYFLDVSLFIEDYGYTPGYLQVGL